MNHAALVLAALTAIHFPVSTSDAQAQAYVDRGLFYYYAYDDGDSVDAFGAAAARDPKLAMAYWGEALADGPDLNSPMTEEGFLRGQSAIAKAVALERDASDAERGYIDAMALRYQGTWTDWNADDAAYRRAMIAIVQAAPNTEGATVARLLAAEALLEHGGLIWSGPAPETADSQRALALVNGVLSDDPENVMANHLCLHLYDAAPDRTPARACALRLDAAIFPPQAEHLAHMPSHYWIETGNYPAAMDSSERAYRLFTQLQQVAGRNPDHDRYLVHDVYVGYSAAMMLGSYDAARRWSSRMDAVYETRFDALTALRFGHFAEAYALASGKTPSELAVRGLAAVELGRQSEARELAVSLRALSESGDLAQLFLARLAESDGKYEDAARSIERAVTLQRDAFADELIPLLPALEARGDFAMRCAAYADAVEAYRATLAAYPNDARALAGLDAARKAQSRGP